MGAIEVLRSVLSMLGFPNAEEKTQVGRMVALLGVQFDMVKLSFKIPELKLLQRCKEIQYILDKGRLSPGDASTIRGKLQWTISSFGIAKARNYMRPFVNRQYQRGGDVSLSAELTESLEYFLKLCQPDQAVSRPIPNVGSSHVTLYTDACF